MQETDQHVASPERRPVSGWAVDEAATSTPAFDPADFASDDFDSDESTPQPLTAASRRRILWAIGLLVLIGLIAVLPPLINVNRYQRRIVTSISTSLGRPVHLDSVTLNVLPAPGFTLTNFTVSEDPAFGAEPVIRAESVRVNLRLSSLWRRKVEFSRIELHDPSMNLVRGANGRWNIESILVQASRMPAVPTAQTSPGDAPRFPYIEATGARVNLKQGLEKKPVSVTDADFALWLPQPETWHLRFEGHPDRTDTALADGGRIRVEGTLGRAAAMEDVPVDLHADWESVPLGATSWVLMGRDANLRGDMTARASVKGTVGKNAVTAHLELHRLRRADFVPAETLDVDLDCKAHTGGVFHQVSDLACAWPGAGDSSGLTLTGEIPDARNWRSAQVVANWKNVPVSALVEAMRAASSRDSHALHASGTIDGQMSCCTEDADSPASASFSVALAKLHVGDEKTLLLDEDTGVDGELADGTLTLPQIPLSLGGLQPAILTVEADKAGLRMHLVGMVLRSRLLALSKALPQFGDGLDDVFAEPVKGLETPVKVDLVAARAWGGTQTWTAEIKPAPVKKNRQRH